MDSFTGCIGTASSNKKSSSKENVVINVNGRNTKKEPVLEWVSVPF